jgi:tRNA pseudouridine55 synthase
MNGVICVDKPAGMTSFAVVARLRRLTGERRAGHSGTLDPMATGVLPVFFGEATKAIPLVPCSDKRYMAGLRLGVVTDTGDVTGRVLRTSPVAVRPAEVEAAALAFKGTIKQVPPMYSALKVGGRRLYDIAREGGTVERAARTVTVYDIAVTGSDARSGDYGLDVSCSKGTYIRTLCEDIGARLGCGGTMSSLRRVAAQGFDIGSCKTLDELTECAQKDKLNDVILKVDEIFAGLPCVSITKKQAVRYRNGGGLSLDRVDYVPERGLCRVEYLGVLIGVGKLDPERREIRAACQFNRDGDAGLFAR